MTLADDPYPADGPARDRWILARRGPKAALDPRRAYASLWEEEPGEDGEPVSTATVFLTNRECPFRCLMCDLWTHTLDERVAPGAIPEQIDAALAGLPTARQIKLYNAGNFFDRNAIPPEDLDAIAARVANFERVVVECHPSLVGDACERFSRAIPGTLEVAMGLETVHPTALERLNKRMTLDTFRTAAERLRENEIALRAFVLLAPPFVPKDEALEWCRRSIDAAFDAGAGVCSVIPTRDGNGAVDALRDAGAWSAPDIRDLERALDYGVALGRGRVFADTWDLERFFSCACSPARAARIAQTNRTQRARPEVACARCAA